MSITTAAISTGPIIPLPIDSGPPTRKPPETAASTRSSTNTGTPVPGEGNTSYEYNVDNQLVQFTDAVTPTNDRYFANDVNGDVLLVIQGNFDGQGTDMTVTQAFQHRG